MENYNYQRPAGSAYEARSRFIQSPILASSLAGFVLVTGLVAFSLYWNITHLNQQQLNQAVAEAESHWNKDLSFRRWAARHGGVYVRPDERTPPNPYLAHLPYRDVESRDGMKLTLMNPAYMMSQMTREFEEMYGIKGKITSKTLLNPNNQPDAWESEALTAFEGGVNKVVEQQMINGQPYLRYMRPMFMTRGCVECHGVLGFKEGDLRGGVSVSVPLGPYIAAAQETTRAMWSTHVTVWLAALCSIFLFAYFARSRRQERVHLLKLLEHDALHDSLTNLPNRQLFSDRLAHAIKRSSRDRSFRFAVCFLDVDRFKNLNDSYGHRMGDELLLQIARRFEKALRPTDSVARIGGDEFTFLLDGVSGLNEAIIISERILAALRPPFNTEVGELFMNASVGICLSHSTYRRAEDMMRDAEIALYRAKGHGKGRVDVFNKDMHHQAKLLMQMENDLRHALEKNQLELHYQPLVDIQENRIYGFEALLRWQHPELGFISPDVFIPIAEDTGLIGEIGQWVVQQACLTVRDWNRDFMPQDEFCLSVNLSAKQLLQPDLVSSILDTLTLTRFEPRLLHCELTETAVIQYREQGIRVIDQLKAHGIGLSVDDFGKGYSSLTYLQQYNFDTLKIDKDFVQGMSADGKGLQLVKVMMTLAQDFDLNVIAEGVEDEDQLNRLRAMGCRIIQGYYYSRPRAVKDIRELLSQGLHLDCDALRLNSLHPAPRAVASS